MPPLLRHICFGPVVDSRDDCLVTQPSMFQLLITLGLSRRQVRIDPERELIEITDTLFFTQEESRTIRFTDVESLDFSDSNFFPAPLLPVFSLESWVVALRLTDGTEVPLLRWTGNFHSPWLMENLGEDAEWLSEPNRERLTFGALLRALLQLDTRVHQPPAYA